MAANFFGFTGESFEQFVRALCVNVFGPGVTTFGDGPDGGREATFRGKVPYPSRVAEWSGYGVIQAKCKARSESTKRDQQWALEQLEAELKTFVANPRRDPKPEYYVFVTNVELSSVPNGGRDRADALVKKYYKKLRMKGHAVWDANQLTTFLATYGDLRARFFVYLTPGDVLHEMLMTIRDRQQPSAARVLTSYLEREIHAEVSARLDQAGNRTDERLVLARLFIDLPASPEQSVGPPSDDVDDEGKLRPGVLAELLRSGSRRLDPKTVYEIETSRDPNRSDVAATFVILGGPGSGKSTVTQFLAQIHRAALLERREAHLLDSDTRRAIAEIRARAEAENLPWPLTPRYPVRVELNRFARALADPSLHITTLGQYLLSTLKGDFTLSYDDLITWVGTYPWLLILDGLDEVPATSNRQQVVDTARSFLGEARAAGGDLFLVVTSRQVGYGQEFSQGPSAFRHVMPLSIPRALQYVERYADVRFGATDPNKKRDVVARLRESATRELTAQLMASPLQVTFMATVVSARGDPGDDRWQLFDSYYRTIYDRERQKAVPPYDAILSKQQSIIDQLHHDIGFWLQLHGESAESAVSLPSSQFERIVDRYLSEVGHDERERKPLVSRITELAQHRLVFLTSRIPGELSFEVRSLQEFMAAECLMSGNADAIQGRLRAIAASPYWRNVLLFAAGRCFADVHSKHLQDSIRVLCEDLNNSNDPILTAIHAGSELALDILQSGVVAENPKYARHLAHLSLVFTGRLDAEMEHGLPFNLRLAMVYREPLRQVYETELTLRVGQSDPDRAAGALPVLLRLHDAGVVWATNLIASSMPESVETQGQLLRRLPWRVSESDAFLQWVDRILLRQPPRMFRNELRELSDDLRDLSEFGPSLSAVLALGGGEIIQMESDFECAISGSGGERYLGGRVNVRGLELTPLQRTQLEYLNSINAAHPGWLPLLRASSFVNDPTPDSLADVLQRCLEEGWPLGDKAFVSVLPWPLAACLSAATSRERLSELSQMARRGQFGDVSAWKQAEGRWRLNGVTWAELSAAHVEPFDGSIALSGPPPIVENYSMVDTASLEEVPALITTIDNQPHPEWRAPLAWFLAVSAVPEGLLSYLPPDRVRTLLQHYSAPFFDLAWLGRSESEDTREWADLFDWLGRHDCRWSSRELERGPGFVDAIAAAYVRFPEHHGLLQFLARMAREGFFAARFPRELIDVTRFEKDEDKLAAICVHLTQHDLLPAEAVHLAQESLRVLLAGKAAHMKDELFATVRNYIERVPALVDFALRVIRDAPPRYLADLESPLRAVNRRRPSELQSQPRRRALDLIMPLENAVGGAAETST